MSHTVEIHSTGQVVVREVDEHLIEVITPGPQGPAGTGIPAGGASGDLLVNTGSGTGWTDAPTVDKLGLDLTAAETVSPGQIAWNATEGTLDVGTPGVTYQVGQELAFRCKNISADVITDGEAVMFAGADSSTGHLEVVHMVADGTVPGYVFFGVATEPIAAGALGYVTTLGKVRNINTSAFPEDSLLWLDPATPGGFTLTEPSAPNLKIAAAAVIKSHATQGILFVRAETGRNIAQCHDVEIGGGAEDQQYLGWDEAMQHWAPLTVPNVAPRSITIAGPQAGDSFTLFRSSKETTISSIVGLVSSGSVTYEIRYAADRTDTGTLASVSDTVTNTTTGDSATVQNQPIASGQWVWVEITAVSGTVAEFSLSVAF